MKTILIAVLIFVLIVAVLLVVLTATVGRRHIKRVSEKAKQKTLYLQNLQTDVELLAEVDPPDAKAALQALAEKLRYSDPMSDETLAALEREIADKVNVLKTTADKTQSAAEIALLLDERNKKCKILK